MPPDNPGLTVIMPVFNTARYVEKAIDSILQQTFSDFELLIIDDGSTDNSFQVLTEYTDERIRLYRCKKNTGKVAACNSLLSDSRGKYITIHDSDDYSDLKRFEKQISFLERNPSYAMCGTQFYEVNEKGDAARKIILETNPEKIKELIKEDSQFHGPTIIIRREILEKIGGLYRNFRNKEDVDLSMRIAEKYNVINLDEYLYYYRLSPQGLSKVDFDYLRFEGLKVLQLLAQQRKASGSDCLMKGDLEEFDSLLLDIKKPYIEDPSLLYRKAISLSVYFKFWRNAFRYAFRAIVANPGKWINYREFLYVVKVSLADVIMRKSG